MHALDAGLAFGITMLLLAMVVTTLVETMHRIFGLREKGLAILIGNFYDRVLASRTTTDVEDLEAVRRRFVEMMTVNRGPVGQAPMSKTARAQYLNARAEDVKFLSWIWGGRRLGSLDLHTFMERLGGSEFGATLVTISGTAGERGIEWTLKDVAQKFDAFGNEASEYFEARARLLSVIVGFVLAFAINVNALALFQTFLQNAEVTEAVIARGGEVAAEYERRLQGGTTPASGPATVAPATPPAQTTTPATREAPGAREQQLSAERARLQSLEAAGVPIGWTDASLADLKSGDPRTWLGILLGGLLMGLGAPLWHSAVEALTGARRVARGEKETTQPPAQAAAPAGAEDMPTTPIEAFQAALGAQLASGQLRPVEEAVG